jgi:glyoxylase-like metal-dependent hydrolase (beta-lactamase superfamily II)
MADQEPQAKPTPSLNLPKGDNTVEVHIINTTTDIVVPAWAFVQPVQKGHETMNMPTFAFLIENKKLDKRFMFDLGCRKDWWNHSPAAHASIKNGIPGLKIDKSINEVLKEGGVDDTRINGVVWSHWHWDHTGDISLFPTSADLYVGPGFKEAFMPGYPGKKDSPMLESDFKGRNVHEVSFDPSKKIGDFPYFDVFGDGSFYLLDVPGVRSTPQTQHNPAQPTPLTPPPSTP